MVGSLNKPYKLIANKADIALNFQKHNLQALDIREAMHFLETITGEVTNEEQLDVIFKKILHI